MGKGLDFVPTVAKQQKEMLKEAGVDSIEELFTDIPKEILIKKDLNIGKGLSEQELEKEITALSNKNADSKKYSYFLGAGCYNHFIPSIVSHLVGRSEFYTSYTPYQPEVGQGTLQSIYEWQTIISILTGMDLANASMYDGASALAEAMMMAKHITKRNEVIVSNAINPQYKETVVTYANAADLNLIEAAFENGITSVRELKQKINQNTTSVLVQHPNFFGCLEDLHEAAELAHEKGALLVVCVNEMLSLGMLKPPADFGADIVCGEAQSFGNSMSFGGPHVGFIATKEKYMRQIPGRIVGKTTDADGNISYVLTLQAREQHIRREKATSNICSNQALCALAATIHITALGKGGIKKMANHNLQLAHYAYKRIIKLKGFESVFDRPFFNEFVVKCKDAKKLQQKLLKNNIIGGYDLSKDFPGLEDCLLFCVTEMNSIEEINKLVRILGGEK